MRNTPSGSTSDGAVVAAPASVDPPDPVVAGPASAVVAEPLPPSLSPSSSPQLASASSAGSRATAPTRAAHDLDPMASPDPAAFAATLA